MSKILQRASVTPGVARLAIRQKICAVPAPNNRIVPVSLQREVFTDYGMSGRDPRAYEMDYLITPALGGTDYIRNLWPQSCSGTFGMRKRKTRWKTAFTTQFAKAKWISLRRNTRFRPTG